MLGLKDTSWRWNFSTRIENTTLTTVNSLMIEGFWKWLVPGLLMYLMATWFPCVEWRIHEGWGAQGLQNDNKVNYTWSAVKLQASRSHSMLVQLVPGTGRWWWRCSPSLSYPSNHSCCWNWTESCRFHYDWLCCSQINREIPGGNKHCRK